MKFHKNIKKVQSYDFKWQRIDGFGLIRLNLESFMKVYIFNLFILLIFPY